MTGSELNVAGSNFQLARNGQIRPYSFLEILEVDYSDPMRIRGSKTFQDSFYKLDLDEFVLFWCLKILFFDMKSRKFNLKLENTKVEKNIHWVVKTDHTNYYFRKSFQVQHANKPKNNYCLIAYHVMIT